MTWSLKAAPGSDTALLHHNLSFPKFSFNPMEYNKHLEVPWEPASCRTLWGKTKVKQTWFLTTSSPAWAEGLRQELEYL